MARNLQIAVLILVVVVLLAPAEGAFGHTTSCSSSCNCSALCGKMVVKNFGTIYRCTSCSGCVSACASRCASKVARWSRYYCGGSSRGESIKPYYRVYSYYKGYYSRSYVCGYYRYHG
ncbi:uncharacterized protein LOC124272698 [Haliotis rubra]|uniref:uncharacterized protein LOC124272698 n=1 Tax=Haliotis rubra TaxID=36100 RepID=UPI001EE56F23|nr:uncharacterized protein LOC124272698 [Haliotis rubra]